MSEISVAASGALVAQESLPGYFKWRHRFAVFLSLATLVLVFIGGLVTSTESGLAVPDWPLSYGMLMPPMVGGIFYEHGHRMVAAGVGLLTLILAVWTARSEPRAGVRRLAWAALAIVITQGLLGGLTVILLLPPAVSITHACLAQTFFCVTIALAYGMSREWLAGGGRSLNLDASGLRVAAMFATAAVFVQLLLGALTRHLKAGLAIPDFPLALGRLIPPLDSVPVAVHFTHRVGALMVLTAAVILFRRSRAARDRRFRRLATLALVLIVGQITLGGITVLSGKSVTPTTLHVATGAAILGVCWLTTLRAHRWLEARG